MTIPSRFDTDDTSRTLAAWQLASQKVRPGLIVMTPLPNGRVGSVGPFVSIARFKLTDRVFPPHPHAGFTAMTYVVRGSASAMYNRDSLGDRSVIESGGAHWTMANSGMMHEETPERVGEAVDGFQIFINHPARAKRIPGTSAHRSPREIPVIAVGSGADLRLVMGRWGGRYVDVGLPVEATLADIELHAGASLDWSRPAGEEAMLYVEKGNVMVEAAGDRVEARTGGVINVGAALGELTLSAGTMGATVIAFAGTPLAEPVAFGGPFIMNDEAAIADAFARFRAGSMGSLAPRDDDDPTDHLQTIGGAER